MIREKTDNNKWQFVFLSADLNAIGDAHDYGIAPCSNLAFEKSAKGSSAVFHSLSMRTSEYRHGKKKKIGFETSDRKHPKDPFKKQKSTL